MNNFDPKYIQSICMDEEIGRMMFELISNYGKETNRFRSRLEGRRIVFSTKCFTRVFFIFGIRWHIDIRFEGMKSSISWNIF